MRSGQLKRLLAEKILIFDGGFGTELYRRNFFVNTSYEELNLSRPETVCAIHQAYVEAGAEVLTTNTYNANALKLREFGISDKAAEINAAAVALAKKASAGCTDMLIAGSIGPVSGGEDEEIKYALQEQLLALENAGADFIIFESLCNRRDIDAALAAVTGSGIAPVFSLVADEDGKLADGSAAADAVALIEKAGVADALGLNCGKGPETTLQAMMLIAERTALPMIIQPGAGVPKNVDNRFMPMTTPEYFTTYALRYVSLGARAVGGCCGISPAHIADLARSLKPMVKTGSSAVPAVEIKETDLPEPLPTAEKSGFGRKLAAGNWLKLVEMTPPRGYDLTDTVRKAARCREAGFDAVNIPDGPRASCRISQVVTAAEIQEKAGIDTVVHCCCRDRNLISIQSMILGCMAKRLNNILFITGDPPKLGDYPFSSGVFDVDSIGLIKLQSRLNRGVDAGGYPLGNGVKTAVVSGAGADPNAIDPEREYRRLAEKVEAGAEFIITQPVFEPEILLKFLKRIRGFNIPVIAGVWPFASYRNALFMQKEVPGVVVPDWVMKAMERAGDKAAQREEGIRIAKTILNEIHSEVRGVATSAPFGNVETAIAVCEGL